ncbi:MAG: RNA-binding S4 domain-containing protein [Clostridia bacterium]|nr:RNA-binding S4 domain-containing protein [Clostridia bacterium]
MLRCHGRRGRKLYDGDIVSFEGKQIKIVK